MVNDVPRRLPPTPEERLKIITSRMSGGSNAGSTRWAAPIASRAGNYSPTNAPSVPDFDVGIYTYATELRTSFVTPDDGNYDHFEIVYASMDAATGLQPGHEYLIEAQTTASLHEPDAYTNEPDDAVQLFARPSDPDAYTESQVVDSTFGVYSNVGAIDDGDYARVIVPDNPAHAERFSAAYPATTIRLTTRIRYAPDATDLGMSIVVRSLGPNTKYLHGISLLRMSDLGAPVIGVPT